MRKTNSLLKGLIKGFSTVLLLVSVFYASGAPIDTNIVGYWPLNQIDGSTILDISGNGNDGTVSGAIITSGQIDSALYFDGVNDEVSLGNLDVVPTSDNDGITLAAWINPDVWVSSSRDDRIISKATGTGEQDHYWMISTIISNGQTRLRFRLKTGSTTTTLISSTGNIQLNTWTHVAASYDGSAMRVFINGSEVGSISKIGTVATSSSVEATIGINPDGQRPFDGQIDEVYILDRALTAQEVSDLMTRLNVLDTISPSVPSELTSENITSVGFTLNWLASTDNIVVVAYEIFQDGVSIGKTGNTTYPVTGLSASTTYGMTVRSRDASSNWSVQSTVLNVTTDVPDTEVPSVPTGLVAGIITTSSVALSWTASADNVGVTGYKLYTDGSNPKMVTGTTSITINNLSDSTEYDFTISAIDATGNESEQSTTLTVTTLALKGDWPNASNTGTSGTLTPSGTITVTQDGALIQNMNVSGDIVIKANNVIIRNCKFNRLWLNIPAGDNYTGTVVEDSEIYWAGQRNFTLRRCELRSVTDDLVRISGGNVLIEDCYLHIDGPLDPVTHADAIQSYPVPTYNSVIRHNTIYNAMVQTSCVNAQDVTLDNNLFAGGGYTLYQSNMTVINNHFSTIFFPNCGKWNILYPKDTPAEWSGNVWHETEIPISTWSPTVDEPNEPDEVDEVEEITSVESSLTEDTKVYPNPINGGDILHIQLSDYNAGMANISIVDLAGCSVYSKLHIIEQSEVKISLNNLLKGIYIISVNGNNINKQQKLIIE